MDLIIDRTEEDVLLGKEKGKYRYSDLNRVEQAVKKLCALSEQLDVYPKLTTKTDWGEARIFTIDNWPTEEQMRRYLQNVTALCDLFEINSANVPRSPDCMDWCGANSIEKALQLVYERIIRVIDSFRYSGELFAGKEIL